MLRSLFAGISGLRAHQSMMDVTGNNIANVNTVGFKSSQTVFQDTLSQLLRGAGAPQGGNGGTNPSQVGLGVRLAGVTTNFGQGSAQTTGRATDLMIQGDGFFVVKNAGETLFTRAGAFSFDTNGVLTTPEGGSCRAGRPSPASSTPTRRWATSCCPSARCSRPSRPRRRRSRATCRATGFGCCGRRRPPRCSPPAVAATAAPTSIKVFDALGKGTDMDLTFTKTVAGWDITSANGAAVPNALTFPTGATPAPATVTFTPSRWRPAIVVDISGLTGFAGTKSVAAVSQDGSAMGTLQAFSMSPDGTLVGVFSNGLKQPLGQVALANFNNPAGLEKVGGSMYRTTVNSGNEQLGVAGSGGRGLLSSGTLEMSNVDLAQEFTNLIVAQRGFQANSRVITTSDQILEDLVNLKR